MPDLPGNLYALRQKRDDLFEELIGSKFEGLHNIYKRNISLKLKAPFMSYIVRDWERLMPVQSRNFEGSGQLCSRDWPMRGAREFSASHREISKVSRSLPAT